MKVIIFIVTIILLSACSKDKSPLSSSPENNYVQGEVSFQLQDSVSLLGLATYLSKFDSVSIDEVFYFKYHAVVPQDSLAALYTALDSKPYIMSGSDHVLYSPSNSEAVIELWIKTFKSNDLEDWSALKKRFSLVHLPYYFQSGKMKVATGREQEYVKIFLTSNLFKNVWLQYIHQD